MTANTGQASNTWPADPGQADAVRRARARDGTQQDSTQQDSTGQDSTGQDRTGQDRTGQGANAAVAALYEAHAVAMIRLAVVITGDRQAAEDIVQEAFCGLYRRWAHLTDTGKALSYLRSAILNGCRSELRRRTRGNRRAATQGAPDPASSAELAVLTGEEHREVLAALRSLPRRQREALVLRYYAELSEPEIAASMGISAGTVKSTTSRALTALGRILQEDR